MRTWTNWSTVRAMFCLGVSFNRSPALMSDNGENGWMAGWMDRMNERAECLGSLGQQCADSWTKGSSFPTQRG